MNIEQVNGIWVPSNDIHIEDWRNGNPFTQNRCLRSFLDWCKNNNKTFDTALDIGAWCGTWSLELSPFCKKIYAFEPDSLHFECLVKNKNSKIEPMNFAVGDKIGSIRLTNDNFTQAKRVEGEGTTPIKTIDSFDFKNVDLIKIDVEGYEMKVINGALNLLKSVSYIMIELNNNSKKYDSSNIEIEKHLKNLGYSEMINIWPDKVFCK